MVDETKPPKGWLTDEQMFGASEHDDNAEVWREAQGASLEQAHRIAREEAQPYIAEVLERIAAWLDDSTNDGMFEQWQIEGTQPWSHDYAAEELRKMATGRRPLPGSEGE